MAGIKKPFPAQPGRRVFEQFIYKSLAILFKTLERLIPLPKTPLKISPSFFSLSKILKMVKSFILNPGLTSSQCSGVDTVAPGFGRNE